MRRRVLQATVAAVAVAVLLLGFPLAFLGAQFVLANEKAQLQGRVDTLARNIDARLSQNEPIPQSVLDNASEGRPGELPAYVFVNLPDGEQMTAGEPISGRVNEAADRT
ncbi:MAG: histidine kinase, partial [Oerskovia sp.]|nr:histidine kinase [Oerskovia sp.]